MVQIKDGNATFNIDDSELKTVRENEMERDPNGIYLDFETENIPDLNNLTNQIITFLEYINKSDMEKMEEEDPVAFKAHLENEFADFSLNYINVYNMLLNKNDRDDNIIKLMNLIEILREVKSGEKKMQDEFNKFKENLSEQFVYPKFGGKENFEKKIKKRAMKKQKKQHK